MIKRLPGEEPQGLPDPLPNDYIWTSVLHISPKYTLEIQIHGYKISDIVGFDYENSDIDNMTYRVKVIIEPIHGMMQRDRITDQLVLVTSREQWINTLFETKEEAEDYSIEILSKYHLTDDK